MENVRNILLIGNAGKGKSTLANVLTETNDFEESLNPINGTEEAKTREFEHEEIKYRVIDTVGTGVIIKQTDEVLRKLEDQADILSEGLNQILFVTNGRFTKEEAEAFDLLRNAIFDDQAIEFTTIVRTNFPSFNDRKICEENRKDFQKEIEKVSKALSSTATTVYVDNPPMEGLYKTVSRESRKHSRQILLNHLRTCQEIYQPELLGKFREMVNEFSLIIVDTFEAIKKAELHCSNFVNFIGEFINERGKILEKIEERREEVKTCMEDRFKSSIISHSTILFGKGMAISGTFLFPPIIVPGIAISAIGLLGATGTDSVAILKEKEAYELFEESLEKDKGRCETLEYLQEGLRETISKFKEIRPRFENSEYRKKNIDRKRIEVIENVMSQALGEEIGDDVKFEKDQETEQSTHSTGKKAVRTILETICKLVPSPYSLYCMYRDHEEVGCRDSLSDMETTIENLRRESEILEEKQRLLNNLYKKISQCQEEIEKL